MEDRPWGAVGFQGGRFGVSHGPGRIDLDRFPVARAVRYGGQASGCVCASERACSVRDGRRHWSFEAFGKNLADKEYLFSSTGFLFGDMGYTGDPMTYGFQVIYSF